MLCIDTPAVSDGVAIRTAMWGKHHRYWDNTAEATADLPPLEKYFPNSRFGLNGRHMLIAVMYWPDYFERKVLRSGEIVYVGMMAEIVADLARYLNFSYSIIKPADEQFGAQYRR